MISNAKHFLAWPALLAAAYLCAVGGTTFVEHLTLGPIAPALLAGLAALWLFARERGSDFVVVCLLGLLVDLTAPAFLGLSMLSFLVAGFIATVALRGWFTRLLLGRLLGTFGFVWFVTQADAIAGAMTVANASPMSSLLWQPAAIAIYTTALTSPAWLVLSWMQESNEELVPMESRPGKIAA